MDIHNPRRLPGTSPIIDNFKVDSSFHNLRLKDLFVYVAEVVVLMIHVAICCSRILIAATNSRVELKRVLRGDWEKTHGIC